MYKLRSTLRIVERQLESVAVQTRGARLARTSRVCRGYLFATDTMMAGNRNKKNYRGVLWQWMHELAAKYDVKKIGNTIIREQIFSVQKARSFSQGLSSPSA